MLTKKERNTAIQLINNPNSIVSLEIQLDISKIIEESDKLEREIIQQNIEAAQSTLLGENHV